MELRFKKSALTCVALEKELGLQPGDIKIIEIDSEGTVTIDMKDAVVNETLKGNLKTALVERKLEGV